MGQPATQNDDVVHPRALLSLGADGLPLDGIDTDSLDLTVTESQTGDHLFGAGEFMMMIQL